MDCVERESLIELLKFKNLKVIEFQEYSTTDNVEWFKEQCENFGWKFTASEDKKCYNILIERR